MRAGFRSSSLGVSVGVGVGLACGLLAGVQQTTFADGGIDPNSGIDFVRITHPNNAPWMGTNPPTPGDRAVGRGSVGYEYHIGKFEVTTAQWAEFYNAVFDRPLGNPIPYVVQPAFWGAVGTPGQNGGTRVRVPEGSEMRMVGGLSWRQAAVLCNWLTSCLGAPYGV